MRLFTGSTLLTIVFVVELPAIGVFHSVAITVPLVKICILHISSSSTLIVALCRKITTANCFCVIVLLPVSRNERQIILLAIYVLFICDLATVQVWATYAVLKRRNRIARQLLSIVYGFHEQKGTRHLRFVLIVFILKQIFHALRRLILVLIDHLHRRSFFCA